MIEKKIASSFFLSAILHAGAVGTGLLAWTFLPPALPAKIGVSSLELDLLSVPVTLPIPSSPLSSVIPSLSPVVVPAPSVIPVKTGIQNPVILDSGQRLNDRGGENERTGRNDGGDGSERRETRKSSPISADTRDKGVRTAEVLGKLQPRYPWLSRKKGEEGEVVLTVRVSAEGRVEDCQVTRSSGFDRLDRSAMEAVASAVFAPAWSGGSAVASSKQWVFDFRLEK